MTYFKDADEVYAYIGRLFEELAEDDELAPKFRKANTIVQYRYRAPESQITVKLVEGEDGQVDCGPTTLEPVSVRAGQAGGVREHGARHQDLSSLCSALINLANSRGGPRRSRWWRSASRAKASTRQTEATASDTSDIIWRRTPHHQSPQRQRRQKQGK